jgi:DNA-binding phage protein
MAKTATSAKPPRSGKGSSKTRLIRHRPHRSPELKSVAAVSEVLASCLVSGDLQSFREVLVAHILTANKAKLAAKARLGRRTLYDILDLDQDFNPSVQTVSALLRALAS